MITETTKDGNKRLRSSYISSVISISLVLFMLGLLALLVLDAKKISDYMREHVQLNIFLKENIPDQQLEKLLVEIKQLPFVRSANYVSKEEALQKLKNELGESAMSMIESNPLPASFDLNLHADYAQTDSLAVIKNFLSGYDEVTEVIYQQNEVAKMNENFRTIAIILLVFCGLLFFVAVVLINNTIRLSMYSKRFLIKSMQLVGATKGFIRWPFLKKGLVHGLYAGVVSILLLSGIIYLVQNNFPELGQLSDLKMIGMIFSGVVIFGFFLSGFSTYFAVNRYLRYRMDDLY